jgi:xanthine dehydrogenase accessory factor
VAAAHATATEVDARAVVVIATQGHGDEDAVEHAVKGSPAYVGLVASRKRGEAVLALLADRGVPQHLLDRVRVPVGLDLGHTTHSEIAVSILAELVQLRASGALASDHVDTLRSLPESATDPVCGMTVTISPEALSLDRRARTSCHIPKPYWIADDTSLLIG